MIVWALWLVAGPECTETVILAIKIFKVRIKNTSVQVGTSSLSRWLLSQVLLRLPWGPGSPHNPVIKRASMRDPRDPAPLFQPEPIVIGQGWGVVGSAESVNPWDQGWTV